MYLTRMCVFKLAANGNRRRSRNNYFVCLKRRRFAPVATAVRRDPRLFEFKNRISERRIHTTSTCRQLLLYTGRDDVYIYICLA